MARLTFSTSLAAAPKKNGYITGEDIDISGGSHVD